MAQTAQQFIQARPEFASAGAQLVAEHLTIARLRVSAAEYGDAYDHAVSLKAAQLLWESPFGCTMRLDGGADKPSKYEEELVLLKRERVPRMGVL